MSQSSRRSAIRSSTSSKRLPRPSSASLFASRTSAMNSSLKSPRESEACKGAPSFWIFSRAICSNGVGPHTKYCPDISGRRGSRIATKRIRICRCSSFVKWFRIAAMRLALHSLKRRSPRLLDPGVLGSRKICSFSSQISG